MRRILFVINSNAGQHFRADIERLQSKLTQQFESTVQVECHVTQTEEESQALILDRARDSELEMVVVAGGDGTVSSVLPVLIQFPKIRLAIIPYGTGNLFAYNLGIKSFDIAQSVIMEGYSEKIDVGCINGHYFILMCIIGGHAGNFVSMTAILKKLFGKTAYYVNQLQGILKTHQTRIKLQAEDYNVESSTAHTLIISNAARDSKIAIPYISGSSWQDGLLDICLIHAPTPWGRLRAAYEIVFGQGQPTKNADLIRFKAAQLKIESGFEQPICVDGTGLQPSLEQEITVLPGAIQVLVPANR